MEQAVTDGLAKPGELVYLRDRVNMHHGRRQTHGTQSWGIEGKAALWPVTDPASLNARRAEVGLFPLDDEVIADAWTATELHAHGRQLTEDGAGA